MCPTNLLFCLVTLLLSISFTTGAVHTLATCPEVCRSFEETREQCVKVQQTNKNCRITRCKNSQMFACSTGDQDLPSQSDQRQFTCQFQLLVVSSDEDIFVENGKKPEDDKPFERIIPLCTCDQLGNSFLTPEHRVLQASEAQMNCLNTCITRAARPLCIQRFAGVFEYIDVVLKRNQRCCRECDGDDSGFASCQF